MVREGSLSLGEAETAEPDDRSATPNVFGMVRLHKELDL